MAFPHSRLGDICEVLDSRRRPITKSDRIAGEYPYYGATGILDYVQGYIFDEKLLLIGEDGAKWGAGENTAFTADGKYWVNNHAHIVRPHRDKVLDRWLVHYLNWQNLNPFITGLTVPKLNQAKMREIPVPLPPVPNQLRIVAILDEAFAGLEKAIANTEHNMSNVQEVFQTYLKDIFGQGSREWKKNTLANMAVDFGRGRSRHRPRNDPKLYGGKYPFIQTGDIRNCVRYITEASQSYNELGLAQSKLWPKGTLCITIAANIAETGILTFDACFPDSVIGMVVDESKHSTSFIEYLLQYTKAELQKEGRGSAQDNINLGTFENRLFAVPDLITQRKIVEKLDALFKQTSDFDQASQLKLKEFNNLKQSLLQKAFAAELK